MITEPGENFESDVRSCMDSIEIAHEYLMVDEWVHIDGGVQKGRVLSLLQLVKHGLEEVINNYHMRVKDLEPLKKVK